MTLSPEEERHNDSSHFPAGDNPQIPSLNLNALCEANVADSSRFEVQNSSARIDVTSPGDVIPTSNGSSCILPPVHPKTAREQSRMKEMIHLSGSQTARIQFAPPQRVKQQASNQTPRTGRVLSKCPPSAFAATRTELRQKQLETIRCFELLDQWQQSLGVGPMKNLLTEVYSVLYKAAYREPEKDSEPNTALLDSSSLPCLPEENNVLSKGQHTLEYILLVADVQEKVKLKQAERKRLKTQLDMEHALQDELTVQLNQLEGELTQLNARHVYNRAEIETERLVLRRLEKDYASLTEEEADVLRDCEVLELQLENERAQLKELRSQQLYLDFVSSTPLNRHMEEKKWQEQYDNVTLQVQNAEAENRKLEEQIKGLDDQVLTLEAQYAREIESKHQSETALAELEASYKQFQESFDRTRVCYTPRPDWDSIVDDTPELSVHRFQWEIPFDNVRRHDNRVSEREEGTLLEIMGGEAAGENSHRKGRTKTLVKEMLNWIERLQKHCGVNLHLSRIWHDVEEARVQLNILHHQLDRTVRRNSLLSIPITSGSGVITVPPASPGTPGSPSKPKQDYIMALGTHEGIPLFLRHQGRLKRRIMKKIDVEKMVRKVWVEKRKREQRNPLGRFPLEQVLYEKLHRKYGFQPLIAEWGYNLLLALQTFSWDSEIEMFLLCLTGGVSDLVYLDQEQMIRGCQQLLLQLSQLYNVESFASEQRVLLKDALVGLRTYFPLKTPGQLQAIEQAIIRDMHKRKRGGNDSILYIEDILPLDVKYPLGFFVKTIRTQHFKEVQDYYGLLLSELEQRDTDQKGTLPLSAVRDAILTIDPLADQGTVISSLMKTMHVKIKAHLYLREIVHYKAFVKKMNAACLMKFTLNYDSNPMVNWRRRQSSVYGASAAVSRRTQN